MLLYKNEGTFRHIHFTEFEIHITNKIQLIYFTETEASNLECLLTAQQNTGIEKMPYVPGMDGLMYQFGQAMVPSCLVKDQSGCYCEDVCQMGLKFAVCRLSKADDPTRVWVGLVQTVEGIKSKD